MAFHLSQNKRQKPFQKATYSPALSWLWPPVPWLPLSHSFSSSHTGLHAVPPIRQLCSCLSFAFGSLCVGTLFPRYLHYLLLQVFLKCHLMGKAFLIICSSILSILLTLIFLLSTYRHLKRYLSVCLPLWEGKVHEGKTLFYSLIQSQRLEESLVHNRNSIVVEYKCIYRGKWCLTDLLVHTLLFSFPSQPEWGIPIKGSKGKKWPFSFKVVFSFWHCPLTSAPR